MSKTSNIELTDGTRMPILYEDRAVLAIDKPRDWMLVPHSWQKTNRNLQAAIASSIAAGDYWSRTRGIKFLRHIHRLDADTTGVLLFAKSRGALDTIGDLFEARQMRKVYLAVVHGQPKEPEWTCRLKLGPDPKRFGRQQVDLRAGKDAETSFKLLATRAGLSLLEVHPLTGRTHQIRLHLHAASLPIAGDVLYGQPDKHLLGLRAVSLGYTDPFTRRRVLVQAPTQPFVSSFGFQPLAAGEGGSPPGPAPGP